MEYKKQSNDSKYRLVNLRQWDRQCQMREFKDSGIVEDNSLYEVLEVEHVDGSREIIPDKEPIEPVLCSIHDGVLEIIFAGPRAKKETTPCLGHIFLKYKNREGMLYHLPSARKIDTDDDSVIYRARISSQINSDDVQFVGDKYFNSAFRIQQN